MKFTRRIDGLAPSATMAVAQEALRLRREGRHIIDLGPGEPDFPTPQPIKEAALQAIREDFTKYTPAVGILELREAVAEKFRRLGNLPYGADQVAVTCGAKHAIYQTCMAVFQEGDQVLIPAPYWVTFPEVVRLCGATPVFVPTRPEEGFLPLPDELLAHAGENTRGLILNTPNNPSGAVISRSLLQAILDLARRQGWFLLFDETYEYFTYDGHHHCSLASLVEEEDLYAVVGSVSKTYSMTGWRIGYCLGPASLIRKIAAFQSHESGNPASISQKAALAALRSDPALVESMRAEYARRRELVVQEVNQLPGFSCAPPGGTFYLFPDVRECLDRAGFGSSQELAQYLLREAGVATVPGDAFGMDGFLRLSYATSPENLREGLRRMGDALRSARPTRS